MPANLFPYSGGKTFLAPWIIEHFPAHERYVEVFGGGGSVLLNKQRSGYEVYNDLDEEVVNFFDVYREQTDTLVEWLQNVPYSRQLHDRWSDQYFGGDLPDDEVKRAGIFFFLRYAQMLGKNHGKSGFQSPTSGDSAGTFFNAVENLDEVADRFRHVTIENKDYREIFEHYDDEETLFYCDPPYLKKGKRWYSKRVGEFDHEEFWKAIERLDGKVAVSYMELPDYAPVDDLHIAERRERQNQNSVSAGEGTGFRVERLLMNYDPEEVRGWKPAEQRSAIEW